MRALLDTHAFVWWVADSRRLSGTAFETIRNEGIDVMVSAASAWEITTKQRLGKLPEADALASGVRAAVADQGFGELAITIDDAERAGRLPGPHRDPFDRMLIAQAAARGRVASLAARRASESTLAKTGAERTRKASSAGE